MPVRKGSVIKIRLFLIYASDCSRALHILTKYRRQLDEKTDRSFRNAVDKLINTLESQLFSSLMDVLEVYEVTLTGNNKEFTSEQASDSVNFYHSGSNISSGNQSLPKPLSPGRLVELETD
ncbi:uncharacterized protein DC041_0008362 [Schistosoma bovis]|uniref:L27 domain-containing protein n=1 Tax=Schistosoma bovis TaxID=6184 RepID=A0A430QHA7_SCHBO|nr:uncharacterized protein DC041_0008362 [Schistosoma bovis]